MNSMLNFLSVLDAQASRIAVLAQSVRILQNMGATLRELATPPN